MPENLLTDLKVKSAKPTERTYKLSDGGGLFLQITPSGGKRWRWKYRIEGKENLFAIGTFPKVSLAQARAARDTARSLIKQGIHPSRDRQDVKRRNIEEAEALRREKDGTFAKVTKAYLADIKPVFAVSSYRTKESRIRKYLAPKLDGLSMDEIGPNLIRPILEACKAHGAWAGIHVKGDLSALFEFAVVRGLAESNPIPGLRGLLRMPVSQSKAVMTREQVQAFYHKLQSYRGYPETVLCLKFIALTACRPGEAADAEWDEFDFVDNLWRRPAAKMKARRDHICPLSDSAIEVLHQIKQISGTGRYLFPHRSGKGFTTPNRLTYAMRDMNLGPRATPHCWRTTFSTWANEHGYRPDAIERQLAHVESNRVRATYNKALLLADRKQLMQEWADYLREIGGIAYG
ncbi:integrase arm-type DNA-binding domain-containing protein [Serratia nevei]|uniref:tyrosine-type recombinase/integrase n=1 Tax=Serratia nevei TaxID=2703794 RepID=UPI00209DE913|nr:site-specific integrase [Serratia nevei]MCP1106295.1 integrase arm-type DNA-binding domain-containing protein [Serratia nevei]